MPSLPLPILLRKYKEVFRRYVDVERELADLDRQIVATESAPEMKPAPVKRPRRRRRSAPEVSAAIRSMLRVMREANESLPPREIASRLGLSAVKSWRLLRRAVELGYVERAGNARYIVSSAVPNL